MQTAKLQWNGVERSEIWRVRPESGFPTRARANTWREVSRCRRASVRRMQRKCQLCEANGERLKTEVLNAEIEMRGAKRRGCQSIVRESGKPSMPDPRAPGTLDYPSGWIAWGRAMWCDAVAQAGVLWFVNWFFVELFTVKLRRVFDRGSG